VPAHDRHRLERLCRYVARPALAAERLARLDDGRLLYQLKRRWRDGTSALLFQPHELLERLAALVPPPRFHLLRYHGVLAPHSALRPRIVPQPHGPDGPPSVSPAQSTTPPPAIPSWPAERYYSWSELMRRVFALDVLQCPQCITDCLPRS